jgi:hypothetical protein
VATDLRLTDDEEAALRERAQAEGISIEEALRRAVRAYVSRGTHREHVSETAERVIEAHDRAIERLGE